MLKFNEAAEAKTRVAEAEVSLGESQQGLIEVCNQLFKQRSEVSRALIGDFEVYVNSLASRPKEYDRTFEYYRIRMEQFDAASKASSEHFSAEIRKAAVFGGGGAGVGFGLGAATAAAAPTAAMAVATTFGTASTGAAISTLSGAAANSAALAWLGGGALTAGGGGMAAGNALLLLAGPVGLAVAGVSVAAGLGYTAYKNRATIENANTVLLQLLKAQGEVKLHTNEVSGIYGLTVDHSHRLRQMLDDFVADAPKDYAQFSERQKELLGAMHNNVLALSRLLKVKPGEVPEFSGSLEEEELIAARAEADGTAAEQARAGADVEQQTAAGTCESLVSAVAATTTLGQLLKSRLQTHVVPASASGPAATAKVSESAAESSTEDPYNPNFVFFPNTQEEKDARDAYPQVEIASPKRFPFF
ncbi:hypothetical protein J2W28_004442 [Variovorax boronicumulans]|uniref:hypothetical protein n=1 Tax=Variovorax boronicumulans TaxID=436515 RepID=UPI002785A613|nr:hypothetical protein [Variovorax boronicumulans]MDP9993856.1 hypothetical protein [Variovorax boronicumulans]MDQ0005280.1 hypothetical protein [Variovorax boronicumulans]